MVRLGERWGPWFRIVNIVAAYLTLPQSPSWRWAAAALALVNGAEMLWYRSGRWIIASGPAGILYSVLHSAAAPVLVGFALSDGVYLHIPGMFPMNTYAAPTLLFLAIYPRPAMGWRGHLRRWLRSSMSDIAVSLVFIGTMSLGLIVNGFPPSALTVGLVMNNYVWLFMGILVGYVAWFIGLTFGQAESELVRKTYEGLERWLHAELKADVASIRSRIGTLDMVHLKLEIERIDGKIATDSEIAFASSDPVSLRVLVDRQLHRWPHPVVLKATPTYEVALSPPTALILNRILGELLSNASKTGCRNVWLSIGVENAALQVLVEDDGPGLKDAKALIETGSLGTLNFDLTEAGGALTYSRSGEISRFCALAPMSQTISAGS